MVVDNGSTDDTAAIAERSGARVVAEAQPGMGHAIRTGFMAARNDWVMKVDADLDKFDISLFSRMIEARAPGIGLVKGMWQDPKDNMPMTRLLVIPALRLMFPGLGGLWASNSGIYIFDSSLIALQELVGEYSADLDVLVRVYAAGAGVTEVDIGRINNNPRNVSHYNAMAETIMDLFLRLRDARITEEMVVLAEDAMQVIDTSLGAIMTHARAGGRVSLYLADTEAEATTFLRDAVAAYPTVQMSALSEAPHHQVSANAAGLRILAPHPASGARGGLRSGPRSAERFRARIGRRVAVDATHGHPRRRGRFCWRPVFAGGTGPVDRAIGAEACRVGRRAGRPA